MKKSIALMVTVFLCLALLSGCAGMKIQENPALRANVDAFLTATLAEDADGAYGMLCGEIGVDEFRSAYGEIRECLKDVDTYELTPIQYNYATKNGVESIYMVYRMVTNDGVFLVSAATAEGYEGLVSLYVTPEEQTTLTYTGTPGHMQGANALQWTVLLIGILSWVFVLWACVDCGRRKIKRKVLWILLILLIDAIVSLRISGTGVKLNFNIGLYLKLSALIRYGNGATQLSLVIPVGAIIYLFSRKNLIEKGQTVETPVEEIPAAEADSNGDTNVI